MKKQMNEENKKYCDETIAFAKKVVYPDPILEHNNTIELNPLCLIHAGTEDKRRKSILEELFFLCTNDDFCDSIATIRSDITRETKIALPTKNLAQAFLCREILHENKKWNWYQSLLENIRQKHELMGEAYTGNPFSSDEFIYNFDSMKELIAGDPLMFGEMDSVALEKEARKLTIREALESRINNLESIIFFNNPIFIRFFSGIPHSNRGGFLKIRKKDCEIEEPYIEGKFYLKSTKADMLAAIERDFDEIAKKREKLYGIKTKKDSPKEKLAQAYRIFQLRKQGETDARIAVSLEKEGLSKTMSIDNVQKITTRTRASNKRFDLKRTG